MDRYDKKEFKESIDDIKNLNIEQIILMLKYFIEAYIQSIIIFGFNHKITKECKYLWDEFILVLKEEKNILKFLKKNTEKIVYNEVHEYLSLLDKKNTELVDFWYYVYDGILDACETKCEFRAEHKNRDFKTLIEDDELQIQAAGLTISFDDIKTFLNYPQEFWDYITPRIRIVDSPLVNDDSFSSILKKINSQGILEGISVLVPSIINLQTAYVNVKRFKYAYDLYKRIGQKIYGSDLSYEEDSINLKESFSKEYVLKRYRG